MKSLKHSPKIGTHYYFWRKSLIAAASYATLKEVLESGLMNEVEEKRKTVQRIIGSPGKLKSKRKRFNACSRIRISRIYIRRVKRL